MSDLLRSKSRKKTWSHITTKYNSIHYMSVSCRKSKEKPEVVILKPKSLRLQLSSLRAMLIFPKPPQQVQEIVKAEGQNQQDRCALSRERSLRHYAESDKPTNYCHIVQFMATGPSATRDMELWCLWPVWTHLQGIGTRWVPYISTLMDEVTLVHNGMQNF